MLRVLAGLLAASSGEVKWTLPTRIGDYAQESEALDFSQSIIEEVPPGRHEEQTRARTILGGLNIETDEVYQTIGSLSLGERRMVSLAKIIRSDANVLILDEPTNHLEIAAWEAVEDALQEFFGTIIFVSHDRYFVDQLATHPVEL